ncbi:MAG: transposase, partial [Rickettsiaceae bacterium]
DGNKKRGGQRRYSDKAILMCLQIRYLFGLKLRQSQVFINWIFEISELNIHLPGLYNLMYLLIVLRFRLSLAMNG